MVSRRTRPVPFWNSIAHLSLDALTGPVTKIGNHSVKKGDKGYLEGEITGGGCAIIEECKDASTPDRMLDQRGVAGRITAFPG